MNHQLDTLLHLDTRLRTLVLRALIARWQAGEREIRSQDIYAQLVANGVNIPAGAMAAVFDNLRELKLSNGSLPENSAALIQHGDTCITWVHPCLLDKPRAAGTL